MTKLLHGSIRNPDGEWLVGDSLPDGHPGRTKPGDPRGLYFKVWVAGNSEKYLRANGRKGWEPPLPAHGGRIEFVQVLDGKFAIEREGGEIATLEDGGAVTLGPSDYRCWFLPEGSNYAAGITICHRFNRGGFLYRRFSEKTPYVDLYPRDHRRLVVVLKGVLKWMDGSELNALEYEFWEAGDDVAYESVPPDTKFAALYF